MAEAGANVVSLEIDPFLKVDLLLVPRVHASALVWLLESSQRMCRRGSRKQSMVSQLKIASMSGSARRWSR